MSSFDRWPDSLDPDEPIGKTYMFPILTPAGVTIVSANVKAMDPTSTTPDPAPVVTISAVAIGVTTTGTPAVSFHVVGAIPSLTTPPIEVFIRCEYVLSDGTGDHFTGRLEIEER